MVLGTVRAGKGRRAETVPCLGRRELVCCCCCCWEEGARFVGRLSASEASILRRIAWRKEGEGVSLVRWKGVGVLFWMDGMRGMGKLA